jgi:hypothetical protein
MLDIRFQGLRIEATLAATRELMKEAMDLYDVAAILQDGYDCGTGRRQEGIIERCVRKEHKVTKVVAARTSVRYPDGFQETVWRIIHIGSFSYAKKHKVKK